jgi:hypothetical protein
VSTTATATRGLPVVTAQAASALIAARGLTQVPLPCGRAVATHAGGVEGIVRGGHDAPSLVGHGILDVVLLGQELRQPHRREPIGEDHLRQVRHIRTTGHRNPEARLELRCAGRRPRGRRESAGGRQRRTGLELHDDASGPADIGSGAGLTLPLP